MDGSITALVPQPGGLQETNHSKIQDLLEAFLSGRSDRTIEAYRADLESFARFLDVETIEEAARQLLSCLPGEANYTVLRWKQNLLETHAPATVNRHLSTLRSMVKMGRLLGLIAWSIEVPNEKSKSYRDTAGPGKSNVRKILDNLESRRDPKGLRDTAVVRTLYDLGLRRAELTALDLEDIDFESSKITILGKGRKETERLSLPKATQEALKDWIGVRGTDPGPLFLSFYRPLRGEARRITADGVRRVVQKLGKDIGVQVRPHGLRHSSITEAVREANRNGVPLVEVLQFSRHSSLETLKVYFDNDKDSQGTLAEWISKGV